MYALTAVCDLSEPVAQAVGASFGVRSYSNIREFFEHERLDVVLICTPFETHHLIANIAADYRVHMLIETPLGQTRQMMDFIYDAVSRAGVKAEVAENIWRRPSERLSKNVIDAGLVGRVLRVSSYYDDAGGNCCYHTMSRMRLFAGADVSEVRAYSRAFMGIASGTEETWNQALLFFSNGVLGSCTYVSSWTEPSRRGHPRFMSIEGTNGFILTGLGSPNLVRLVQHGRAVDYPLRVEMQLVDGREVPFRFYYETNPEVQFVNPFHDRVLPHTSLDDRGTGAGWGGPGAGWDGIARADELASIYRAVTMNEEPSYGLASARRDQELSITIAESARLGRPLPGKLENGQETVWESERHEAFRQRWGFDPFKPDAFLS